MDSNEYLSKQTNEENGRFWNDKKFRLEYRRNFDTVAWIDYSIFMRENWLEVVNFFEAEFI